VFCPGQAPPSIISCTNPSGGTGNLEIVWLKSSSSCAFPTTTAAQIAAGLDPHWKMIPGATSLTYNVPDTTKTQTCYLRCVRRAGCPSFIESNIISLTIDPNCGGGGGGTPNCANIGISTQPGKIIVTGVGGAPIASIQVFNAAWQTVHNCFGNCSSPTANIPVPAGTYYVYVKYYSASYQFICEKQQTVNVVSALQGSQDESLHFGAIKHEAHTELIWSHSGGFHVSEYILERSLDGVDFEVIGGKASLGGNSQELYEDFDFEPATGDNHYRLKMVDLDGSVHYSEVKLINYPRIIDYALFPNPANGFVKANLETVMGATDVSITIFNNLGLEMRRFHLDEVYSKYYQMDIRDLHEGYYIVWLNVPGKRPIAKTLMVGKI
jgi:hypothetical protein